MRIEIETSYFPRLTEWHLRRALKLLHPLDLAGVEFIRLMDEDPESTIARKHSDDVWSYTYHGRYVRRNSRAGTHINLYTRDLYFGIPLLLKPTPVATLSIAHTLAHEVGHHLVTKRGYIYLPTEKYGAYGVYNKHEERMCDGYARDVIRRAGKSWYLKIGHRLGKALSGLYVELGAINFEKQNYKKAADYWFRAHHADGSRVEAAGGYEKAIEQLKLTRVETTRRLRPTT
jgi:hypothetical protein